MKENTPDDLARDYLKRKLTRPNLENFEKSLDNDPDLAREVALLRTEMAASELLIASETRDLLKEWQAERATPHLFLGIKPVVWLGSIAAGLLLIFSAIQVFYRPPAAPQVVTEKPLPPSETPVQPAKPQEQTPNTPSEKLLPPKRTTKNYRALAAQHLPEPVLSNLRRIPADSTASIFRRAQDAYAAGNYRQTLDLLAQTDSSRLQASSFLSAYALFHLQRFEEAESQFARLITWNSRQFRYSSEWGLLMCRLTDFPHREKEVRQQLNEILAKPEHPYFEQGKMLEKALKE